jgi:hypothetical protein
MLAGAMSPLWLTGAAVLGGQEFPSCRGQAHLLGRDEQRLRSLPPAAPSEEVSALYRRHPAGNRGRDALVTAAGTAALLSSTSPPKRSHTRSGGWRRRGICGKIKTRFGCKERSESRSRMLMGHVILFSDSLVGQRGIAGERPRTVGRTGGLCCFFVEPKGRLIE